MNRKELFFQLFPKEPAFRYEQLMKALFDIKNSGFGDITPLSQNIREKLESELPFWSFGEEQVLKSKNSPTQKAILTLSDGSRIETVLMGTSSRRWTICVSSQVGCAMKCGFCSTGKMGFKRNLTVDEIVDQFRFWQKRLAGGRISNVVFMGMGEPLANYDAVKQAINQLLKYSDIGPNHITVSTVGHLEKLNYLLDDVEWPPVRLAISLHSADADTRKKIVPTSSKDFLKNLQDWARLYLEKFGNRKHHLTFEYVMLNKINDTKMHAQKLAQFVNSIGRIKVNLIPYNKTGSAYQRSLDHSIQRFKSQIEAAGITCTVRRSMGEDIVAACGQLVKLGKA